MGNIRIGSGTDYHQMVEGRELWLGGVLIPHHKGALGHSDGDVMLHAICDALLGSLALGDIGTHFPNTDPAYKDIASIELLKKSNDLVLQKGWKIINIDCTVCLENPKIKKFVPGMCAVISDCLGIHTTDISIKATTTEELGFAGREEGLFANAVVLIEKN